MPGSGSTTGCFPACFLALLDFFGGGDLVTSWSGLKGCDWLWELMIVSHITAWDNNEALWDG